MPIAISGLFSIVAEHWEGDNEEVVVAGVAAEQAGCDLPRHEPFLVFDEITSNGHRTCNLQSYRVLPRESVHSGAAFGYSDSSLRSVGLPTGGIVTIVPLRGKEVVIEGMGTVACDSSMDAVLDLSELAGSKADVSRAWDVSSLSDLVSTRVRLRGGLMAGDGERALLSFSAETGGVTKDATVSSAAVFHPVVEGTTYSVLISDLASGLAERLELRLDARVLISNDCVCEAAGAPSDGRDFLAFYELGPAPLALDERMIPRQRGARYTALGKPWCPPVRQRWAGLRD